MRHASRQGPTAAVAAARAIAGDAHVLGQRAAPRLPSGTELFGGALSKGTALQWGHGTRWPHGSPCDLACPLGFVQPMVHAIGEGMNALRR
jgi:hypothetical protein